MAPKTRKTSQTSENSRTKTSTEKKIKKTKTKQVKIKRKCRLCDQIYENQFAYARHSLTVHHKQVKCPMHECSQKMKSVSGLMNHLRTTHKNACNLCGHSNKNKNGLLVHLALVHNLKRCVCNVSRRERMNVFFE